MKMGINIVDLKENLQYLEQYLELRNNYIDALLTNLVNYKQTKIWIQSDSVIVKIAFKKEILLGAVILYLEKNNEVSIFVKEKNKGVGSLLLKEIEDFCREKKLAHLYSWVEDTNQNSSSLFLKNKYTKEEKSIKINNNKEYTGYIFKKELSQ